MTNINDDMGAGQLCSAPFAEYAALYYEMGLCVIPTGKADGKAALIKWKPYQTKRPSHAIFNSWLEKYAGANIAIVTGKASGITVVDIDSKDRTPKELQRVYSETPVIVSTPRGYHLYYRYNGEKNKKGFKLHTDVKSDGGYILAPPSYNPSKNASYCFYKSSIDDLRTLPFVGSGALLHSEPKLLSARAELKASEGNRNNTLYKYLWHEVIDLTLDKSEFLALAHDFNLENLSPPLPSEEVDKTALNVLNFKVKNPYKKPFIIYDLQQAKILARNPYAFSLYYYLKMNHSMRTEPFAISPKAIAPSISWSVNKLRSTIKDLIEMGLITRVHSGGSCKKDAHLYEFTNKQI